MITIENDSIILETIDDLYDLQIEYNIFDYDKIKEILDPCKEIKEDSFLFYMDKKRALFNLNTSIAKKIHYCNFAECIDFSKIPQDLLGKKIYIRSKEAPIKVLELTPNSNTLLSSFSSN